MSTETAILAGGCFWGMQHLLRRYPGVISTRAGYTGGDVLNATYRNHGTHAEAIEIIFDPQKLSYRELLEFFFQIQDPTTLNRQGNDLGTSYRSAIFYTSEDQQTSKPLGFGRERLSRKSIQPALSGKPSQNIKTTWSITQTATVAISLDLNGSFRAEWQHIGRARQKSNYKQTYTA
jgi:methionine-S-sulfoxide reductase